MSGKRGFTLVEMLVVIAIVAVLCSLLFPALTRGKNRASQVICSGNLKQLGIAAMLYWDDHEGRAFKYRGAATNGGDIFWFGWLQRGPEGKRNFDRTQGALGRYVGGKGIEVCPGLDYRMAKFKLKAAGAAYGYGYNINFSPLTGSQVRNVAEVPVPTETALFGDAAQVNTFQAPASPQNPMLEEFYYLSSTEPTTHFRHSQRAGLLFVDGHAGLGKAAAGSIDARLPSEQVGKLEAKLLQF